MAVIGGTVGDDLYEGTSADDIFEASAGDDTLAGGAGLDLAEYGPGPFPAGIFVNATAAAIDGVAAFTVDKRGAGTDSLDSIERFGTTDADDVVHFGPGSGTEFLDRAGDDVIFAPRTAGAASFFFGAGSGDDSYTGTRARFDSISYADRGTDAAGPVTQGIAVDLALGTAQDGWGGADRLAAIENVNGTRLADVIAGDAENNVLAGGAGDDTLVGAGGSDRLDGGAGDDSLDGGAGDDALVVSSGNDFLDGGPGQDRLSFAADVFTSGIVVNNTAQWIGGAAPFTLDKRGLGIDTLVSIEQVESTSFDDVVYLGPSAAFGGLFVDRAGDDVIVASQAPGDTGLFIQAGSGADSYTGSGAPALDTVSYADPGFDAAGPIVQGARVDLAAGTATDGWGFVDTLAQIDAVEGTSLADFIAGDAGGNALAGAGGDDTLEGGAGADTLAGGPGDDVLAGGPGADRAVWEIPRTAATVTLSPQGIAVEDRRAEGLGTDSVRGVEVFGFADGDWRAEWFTGVASLSEQALRDFVEVYIAYFGRAPDAEGLFFYGTVFANGTSLEESAATFPLSEEYRAAYPVGGSDLAFATAVYQNVLGRAPDREGLDFWVEVLASGQRTRDVFVLEVLKGAKGPPPPAASQDFVEQKQADQLYLQTKTDIGIYFAVVKGLSDVAAATATMEIFDEAPAGVDAAVATIDAVHAEALDQGTGAFLLPLVGVVDDPFAG